MHGRAYRSKKTQKMSLLSVLFLCLECARLDVKADESFVFFLSSPIVSDSENYPSNARCTWTIKARANKVIHLKFVTFDTYGAPPCDSTSADTLKIYDDSEKNEDRLIAKYCGNNLPADVVSSWTYLHLVFKSGIWGFGRKKGFRIEYKAVDPIISRASLCTPNGVDNTVIDLQASTSKKYIRSPFYPKKYPSGIECVWIITASSHDKKIKITWKRVEIFNFQKENETCSPSSNIDVLTVSERLSVTAHWRILQTICSSSYSITISSSEHTLKVRFKSNLDNYFPEATAGFEAEYMELDPKDSLLSSALWIVAVVIGLFILTILMLCCVCFNKRRNINQRNTATFGEDQNPLIITEHSSDQTLPAQTTHTQPDQEIGPSTHQYSSHSPECPYDEPPPPYPGLPSDPVQAQFHTAF